MLPSDGFTAQQHSDSCSGFFAVGERCDVSFKSVPVSAAVLLHNLAQGASSREDGRGSVRKHTYTHSTNPRDCGVSRISVAGETIQTGIIWWHRHMQTLSSLH